jgi:hypothetical protein
MLNKNNIYIGTFTIFRVILFCFLRLIIFLFFLRENLIRKHSKVYLKMNENNYLF